MNILKKNLEETNIFSRRCGLLQNIFDKRSKCCSKEVISLCCRKRASLPIWILLRMVADKFSPIMPPVPRSNIGEWSILGTPTLINEFCLPSYDDITILKSFAQKSPPIVSNELQKHWDEKIIALFNVLLFRMSLKSIDIKISIAPSNVP